MVHWYLDEVRLVERMRETQRAADRAQALGLLVKTRHGPWRRRNSSCPPPDRGGLPTSTWNFGRRPDAHGGHQVSQEGSPAMAESLNAL